MAFQAVEDVIQVEVRCDIQGKAAENSLYYRKLTGSVVQDDVDEVATLVDDAIANSWLPLWNVGVTYVETYARDLTAEISYQAAVNTGAGAGTRAGTIVEWHTAAVILRRSGLVGRSANGRIYVFGGVSADRATNRSWMTAYLDAWVSELNDTDAILDGQGYLPVIVSRKLAATLPSVLATFEIETWAYANTNMAAIRHRS